jgi:hypothetical protein
MKNEKNKNKTFCPGCAYELGQKVLQPKPPASQPRGGLYVPAGKRARTKGWAFCPASVIPVGQPGQKPLTARNNRHVLHVGTNGPSHYSFNNNS